MIKKLLTVRWVFTTFLVLLAAAVMVRLGIWQLDRLAWRREFNSRVIAQINQPQLLLDGSTISQDLYDMEYRKVELSGSYDFSQEVLLRNQVWGDELGFHLLTPLIIDGTNQAVIIDRGWIPADQASPERRPQFHEDGKVTVQGVIRRPQVKPDFGGVPDPTLAPGQTKLDTWNIINVDRLKTQINVTLLPVYIQQAPNPSWVNLPYRKITEPEITEGPHMGYALQWFTFALILLIGYPFFIRKQLQFATATPTDESLPVDVDPSLPEGANRSGHVV